MKIQDRVSRIVSAWFADAARDGDFGAYVERICDEAVKQAAFGALGLRRGSLGTIEIVPGGLVDNALRVRVRDVAERVAGRISDEISAAELTSKQIAGLRRQFADRVEQEILDDVCEVAEAIADDMLPRLIDSIAGAAIERAGALGVDLTRDDVVAAGSRRA